MSRSPETDVRIQKLEPETSVPENNLIETFADYYPRAAQWIKSLLSATQQEENPIKSPQRSLMHRHLRAQELARLQKLRSQERKVQQPSAEPQKRSPELGRELKRLYKQSLNQSEISVLISPEIGVQKSRFVMLEPSQERKKPDRNPIFLIGGIANDTDPVMSLANSLALSGKTVVVLGYPESTLGTVTPEFAEAVERRGDLSLHAKFFQQAIQEIAQQQGYAHFDLWSQSTGGPIAAELLNNTSMRLQTENAVFIAPMKAIEQSIPKLGLGMLREVFLGFKNYRNLARYSLVMPSAEQKASAQQPQKDRIFKAVLQSFAHRYRHWDTIAVNGGSIIFCHEQLDGVSNSAKAQLQEQTGNAIHLELKNRSHISAFINPDELIEQVDAVFERQKKTVESRLFGVNEH